jgi:hypothetical protein
VVVVERLLHGVQLTVGAMPSMVVTSCPSACTARTLHDFTLPVGVHGARPQLLVSHPTTVPTFPTTSRR